MERRRYFTPMVHSVDGITGTEAVAEQIHLAFMLSNKLKRKYSEMCGSIRARMSLEIVRSNTLLLQGVRDKEAYIHRVPDLEEGIVMVLLVPWRG